MVGGGAGLALPDLPQFLLRSLLSSPQSGMDFPLAAISAGRWDVFGEDFSKCGGGFAACVGAIPACGDGIFACVLGSNACGETIPACAEAESARGDSSPACVYWGNACVFSGPA